MIDFHSINSVFRDHCKIRMHFFILLPLLATAALCRPQEDTYTDRFDSINVDEIIANRRLLVPYVRCVLDQGRCTPEGKELKVHVTDAMQTACKKCTDKQKVGARKVVNHIREKETEYWAQLQAKYDPTGEFKPIYEPFLAGEGETPVVKETESVGDKKTNTGEEKIADLEEKKGNLVKEKKGTLGDEKKGNLVEEKKGGVVEEKKVEVVEKISSVGEEKVGGIEEEKVGGIEEEGIVGEERIAGLGEEKIGGLGEEKIGVLGEERKADLVDAREHKSVEIKKTESVENKKTDSFIGEGGRFV